MGLRLKATRATPESPIIPGVAQGWAQAKKGLGNPGCVLSVTLTVAQQWEEIKHKNQVTGRGESQETRKAAPLPKPATGEAAWAERKLG